MFSTCSGFRPVNENMPICLSTKLQSLSGFSLHASRAISTKPSNGTGLEARKTTPYLFSSSYSCWRTLLIRPDIISISSFHSVKSASSAITVAAIFAPCTGGFEYIALASFFSCDLRGVWRSDLLAERFCCLDHQLNMVMR